MRDGFDIAEGDVRIRVEGLGKTLRAMSKAGADSEDLQGLMHGIGSLVIRAATPPNVSGTLAGTLRAGRGKTKSVIRAGGARAPYAGVIHYGWPNRNITAQPFLTDALRRQQSSVLRQLDAGILHLMQENNLT